ncbi:hypothetical protein CVCC1112_2603 [Paenarthrobacter nicotinovorans]|nr:hypothetical protein CVCC1112_2603 [Paenarthrobacter nicotinovorans]
MLPHVLGVGAGRLLTFRVFGPDACSSSGPCCGYLDTRFTGTLDGGSSERFHAALRLAKGQENALRLKSRGCDGGLG